MAELEYIWRAGHGSVMHLAETDTVGRRTMRALCRISVPFDRTINAPFGLGRRECKRCVRAYDEASRG